MEKEVKNIIIDVIPLTRLPLNRQQHFSYLHSEKIPFGSLVSIPLFRRNINGIAIGNRDDFFHFGNIKLRKINKILDEGLITEKQLELAKFVSEYYLCPLGIALKFFAVKKIKARSSHVTYNLQQTTYNKQQKSITLSKEQRKILGEINKKVVSGKLSVNSYLIITGKEKIEIYLELINKTIKLKKQILLLVPEISLIYQSVDIIKKYFSEEIIAVFHSQLKGSELYGNFQRIKSDEAKIIIGTRQSVFAPFKDLGLIIIDEEQDISYKQWDMNPRYSAVRVSEKLAESYKAKLLLCSEAPSVETWHKMQNAKIKIQNDNAKLKIKNFSEIIDLRKEGWSNNSRKKKEVLISKKLESEIRFALKYGRQAFLFVNRRGMSSFSICNNCREVLRCPRCERALIYDKAGHYRCLHCAYKTDIFPHCPKCQATEFRNIGTGNQAVEREIKKIFPEAKIKLIDFESLKNKEGQKELINKINQREFDIIIGTQTILKAWDLPHLNLIAIINANELLNSSEFNSDERFFQIFKKAEEKIKKTEGGKLIIQTYNPESPIIKLFLNPDSEEFYKNELEQRKMLKFPPFYKLIKLILRAENKKNAEKEAKIVFEKIKDFSKNDRTISIFGPSIPLLSKIRDSFRKQIIIKIGEGNIPENLVKYLKELGSHWIIDVDPININ